MPLTVDEERRRPRHPAEIGRFDVLGDAGVMRVPFQVVAEAIDVQPEFRGVTQQITEPKIVLARQQQVVHRPERILCGGGLGCLGGELGLRVHIGERQVAPDVADVRVGQQIAHDGLGPPAVRALEVAELDHCDRRTGRSADVILRRIDLGDQILDEPGVTEQGTRAALRRQHGGEPVDQPGQGGRDHRCRKCAELGFVQGCAGERARCDEQGDREPDPSERAAAEDGRPPDRWSDPAAAEPAHRLRRTDDRDRLAHHVADQHTERDGRRVGVCEEAAVEHDSRVRQREQRHDDVARPRVVEGLQPRVRRQRRGQPRGGRARQLRGRLLTEAPHQTGRLLELAARRRVRRRRESDREAGDDWVDAARE